MATKEKLTGFDFMTAVRGTKLLGVGTHNGEFAGLEVQEDDTVIDSAKADGYTYSNAAGTYKAKALITTSKTRFTQVIISSGSVIAIKH